MKILHLVSGRVFSGAAAAALTDVQALRAAGHEAWLGARGGGRLERDCAEQKVPFLGGFQLGRGAARVLALPADARRLRALIREYRLDVVHVHRSQDQLLARFACGKKRRVRLVRSWHRDPARYAAPLRARMARACDAACCVARVHAGILRAAGAARAAYLPPGVDTGRYRPDARGVAPAGAPSAGLIGRWKENEDRGQRAFLEVLRHLDLSFAWRGVLLGRGEGRAALEREIAAHPARGRLALVETSEDYPAQVAALDVALVFACGADGASRPAVEALASGVPLLLAERPALVELGELGELGEDNACARVLPSGDYRAWAQACAPLLRDPERRKAMSQAARARAESAHALPRRGAALAELYEAPA